MTSRFILFRPSSKSPAGEVFFTGTIEAIDTQEGEMGLIGSESFFEEDGFLFDKWQDAFLLATNLNEYSPSTAPFIWNFRMVDDGSLASDASGEARKGAGGASPSRSASCPYLFAVKGRLK